MIDSEKVAEIKRLLAEGRLSQRKIAATTQISRGTIAAIAAGRRPDYEEFRRRRAEEEEASLLGPVARCPSCGGTVHVPCRLCRVRALLAQAKLSPLPRWPEEKPRVELSGEYRLRYEQVRTRRLRGEPQESPV